MLNQTKNFTQNLLKKDLVEIHSGDTVKVYQKIKIGDQERIQAFEGVVLAKKHGKGISSTITVRKIISGIGVEKIFPVHSPTIEKIEIVRKGKIKKAKLYYLREAKGKKARLKNQEVVIKKQNKEKEPVEK